MNFTLVAHGAPFSSQSCESALHFAVACIAAGHQIRRVFFYHDGVRVADALSVTPQDESSIRDGWIEFHESEGVELAVCIAAALKRGVLNETERGRYQTMAASAHPAFEIVGLGQLIEAAMEADRVVTFGA